MIMKLHPSIQETCLLDKGTQKIFCFSKEFGAPVSGDQKKNFSAYIPLYISEEYLRTPANYFIQTDDTVLGMLVIFDLTTILETDDSYERGELQQEFTTAQNGNSSKHKIKKVTVPLSQDTKLILFHCPMPVLANPPMKREFMELILRYIEETYSDEDTFFFEESEADTLMAAVLISNT